MRGYRRMRRATLVCIWWMLASAAFTSWAIGNNAGPDGLVWFPWIIGGWVVMGISGAAAIACAVVWSVNTMRTELMRTLPRPAPFRPREEPVRRRDFRTVIDPRGLSGEEINDASGLFAGAVRTASGADDAGGPSIRVEPVRRGGTTGLYAPNPAVKP